MLDGTAGDCKADWIGVLGSFFVSKAPGIFLRLAGGSLVSESAVSASAFRLAGGPSASF